MSTWWATEKAKDALRTGAGTDGMCCKQDRIILQGTETNLFVDLSGNITDGQLGPVVGRLGVRGGVVGDPYGREIGAMAVA